MTSHETLGRRNFLLASLASAGVSWGCSDEGDPPLPPEIWVSAEGSEDFGAAWVTPNGRVHQVHTGFRGHDVVQHPLQPRKVLLIARSPGRTFAELDIGEARHLRSVACESGHHLCGHACFSRDGRVLFTSESNYEKGEGRIFVRDAEDYRVLAQFPSHGVGPHEILLMPDGVTLAVANGGLLTHPDTGRDVLNLDTMRSSLTFVDSNTGKLEGEVLVAEPHASVRHLDVTPEGELSIALQMQRNGSDHMDLSPLAASFHPTRGLQVFSEPEQLLLRCQDYMGSTRINPDLRVAGFTSPRGDIALFFHLESGELLGYHRFHDVCGICVSDDQRYFVLSNSAGQIRCIDASTLQEDPSRRLQLADSVWDNHLRMLSAADATSSSSQQADSK